jgi:hypothetical protein
VQTSVRFDFLHDPLPELVQRLRTLRLPPGLYTGAIACATVVCAILLVSGIEALREHGARVLEARADARFEASRAALHQAKLQSEELEALVERDRRLRAIRLSGSLAAARIARTGNSFPAQARLISIASDASGYYVKGDADNLSAIEALVKNLLTDKAVGRPRQLRVTRVDRGMSQQLEFEMRLVGSE